MKHSGLDGGDESNVAIGQSTALGKHEGAARTGDLPRPNRSNTILGWISIVSGVGITAIGFSAWRGPASTLLSLVTGPVAENLIGLALISIGLSMLDRKRQLIPWLILAIGFFAYVELQRSSSSMPGVNSTTGQAISDAVDFPLALVTAIALAVAYIQYKKNDTWKRRELTLSLIDRLRTDDELRLGCEMLDWPNCTLPLPDRYRRVLGSATLRHSKTRLVEAMTRYEDVKHHFLNLNERFIYRETFDALLAYVSRCGSFVETDLLESEDLSYLRYWAKIIFNPPYVPVGCEEIIRHFIVDYEYTGAKILMSRLLNKKPSDWPVPHLAPNRAQVLREEPDEDRGA
jgi:hypothetical protein